VVEDVFLSAALFSASDMQAYEKWSAGQTNSYNNMLPTTEPSAVSGGTLAATSCSVQAWTRRSRFGMCERANCSTPYTDTKEQSMAVAFHQPETFLLQLAVMNRCDNCSVVPDLSQSSRDWLLKPDDVQVWVLACDNKHTPIAALTQA
jgi:hypothetical protein